MMTRGCHHQSVKILEIIVILRKQHSLLANSVLEMHRVGVPAYSSFRRQQ